MTGPRSAFGAPWRGGGASARAKPIRGVRSMLVVHATRLPFPGIDN